MLLKLLIESGTHHTHVQLFDVAESSPTPTRSLYSAEGWGSTEGLESIIAVDEAISCLKTYRRGLVEGRKAAVKDALEKLHAAVASEFATRESFKESYRGLWDAMRLAKHFLDE